VLRAAAGECQGCDLYKHATQVVFGEGPRSTSLVFIGEQPGDEEDLAGRPFVGPAGRLFDRALQDAGIERSTTYVTNAVKHFKFEMRGKRRIHKKPGASEIKACGPWLEAEVAVLKPLMIVCLGATAARAVFGAEYRVTKERGRIAEHPWARYATSTIHPSAVLRAPDAEQRQIEYERFTADLAQMQAMLKRSS
jgi:uracil-DNA glycosylase family protein